ncbi:hypothetical protein HZM62_004128 [Salmonella enterica]|nr:hypothetical protein [Salmonella enterica]
MYRNSYFLAILCFSITQVNASVIDQSEVEFSGYVIEESPRWLWNVNNSHYVWDVDVDNAKIDTRGWQIFNLEEKGKVNIIEGYLKKIAQNGGVGMTPEITFSSDGKVIYSNWGDFNKNSKTHIPVKNAITGEIIGELSFTIDDALVVAQGSMVKPDFNDVQYVKQIQGIAVVRDGGSVYKELSSDQKNTLISLLQKNENSINADFSFSFKGEKLAKSVLSDNSYTLIASAYSCQLSDFELSWPQEKIPTLWQARLTVSVTIQ